MILDSFRLDGKVALVTGAGRGLGRACALGLAEAGADIALLDRSGALEAADEVRALGRRAYSVKSDFLTATATDLAGVVDEVVENLGGLDVLVNNAGTIRRSPAVDFPQGDWDDVIAVNLDAVFFLSQAAGRHMIAQGGGRIINVASMLSFQGGVNVASYTATKHAVAGLTKALANEWAGSGVNVNAIAPGYMATDNTAPLRADADRSRGIMERIPAGRWGTPEDLQGVAVFLASDASNYMHGAIVPVDGGWLAR
ncbi:2-dehydro-3-deoxy-D-gluconate 5-dehydrogenase KduD [Demequina lutea]|uniref:2-deoxy-D-gluconate 3-dehydrogenase n=1 Tax=Demequina lutea TaxID=431489 RepID=A0A7Y9ZBL2_9MICO|nr:2-dehydro-3-deoxy-D-gluconate 5-dehydrogenase KduD [Demequina lutea]NYI42171.1 2-deoxy-D-gluconate 3-dehydrogenase [Demequina lutea]